MAYAASDNIIWQNSYGGNGNEHGAIAFSDSDGGYTLIGDTTSFGDNHIYVVTTDPDGTMETQNAYGPYNGSGPANTSTPDGGYVSIGSISPNPYVDQMTVNKYAANGTLEWQTIYGSSDGGEGMGSVFTSGSYIQLTSDGGYIVSGSEGYNYIGSGSDAFLVKLSANGMIEWHNGFGVGPSPETNVPYDANTGDFVSETPDGGYVLMGSAYNFDIRDWILIARTDANGSILWQQLYGGPNSYSGPESIYGTADGGCILIGGDQHWIRFDNNGNFVWDSLEKGKLVISNIYPSDQYMDGSYRVSTIGDPGSRQVALETYYYDGYSGSDWITIHTSSGPGDTTANALIGGDTIAGSTTSYGNGTQAYLAKMGVNASDEYDEEWYFEWIKPFGGSGDESANFMSSTSDGGYIIVGNTTSYGHGVQVFVVKTDADGSLEWQTSFGGSGDDMGDFILQTSDGGYIIAGSTTSFGNGSQAYLVKLSNGSMSPSPSSPSVPCVIRGQVLFNGAPVSGVTVTDSSDSVDVTNVSGYYGVDAPLTRR